MDVVVFRGVVQHGVEAQVIDFGDGADVAGDAGLHFLQLLALDAVEVADLEGFPRFAYVELGIRGDRTLEHAEGGGLADVGIDFHLEHVGQNVFVRIRLAQHGLRRIAFALDEQGRIALGGIGQQLGHHVEQLGNASAGAGRDEAHRHQMVFTQGLLEGRVELLRRHFALFQVNVHQCLIHFHHLIHQGAVGLGHGGEIGFAAGVEEAVGDLAAARRRQVDGQALAAEGGLDVGQQAGQVEVFLIDLVDDDHAVQLAGLGPVHHAVGGELDALLRVDHHHGGLHGVQGAHGLSHEVGVAGGVEQVDAHVLMIEVGDGKLDGMLVGLFQGIVIAHGGATLHGTGCEYGAGGGKQGFDQAGLAGTAVADHG